MMCKSKIVPGELVRPWLPFPTGWFDLGFGPDPRTIGKWAGGSSAGGPRGRGTGDLETQRAIGSSRRLRL